VDCATRQHFWSFIFAPWRRERASSGLEIGKDCTFVIASDSECVLDTEYEPQVVE